MAHSSQTISEVGKPASEFAAPVFMGLALFALTLSVHLMANGTEPVAMASVTLVPIIGVAAVTGLLWLWAALSVGLARHDAWGVVHHTSRYLAKVPQRSIPFCAVKDLLLAGILVLLFAV